MSEGQSEPIMRGQVVGLAPEEAVDLLAAQLHQTPKAGVIFFCSPEYDADALAVALTAQFDCPVVGCTSAGEIGSAYQQGGIVALSFCDSQFRLHPYLIDNLNDFDGQSAEQMVSAVKSSLVFNETLNRDGMFAFLLLDGLSVAEERVIAAIDAHIQTVSMIGGSAGDSLAFQQTRVFAQGAFHVGAGVFCLIESRVPFETFRHQHFEPSEADLVITSAAPGQRIVYEINGEPAAQEYANLLGLEVETLTPQVFACHPLMLEIGGKWYVRSIQKVNEDGSLSFFCAIDDGLVLTLARGNNLIHQLETVVEDLLQKHDQILCTLGCDCILRRLELERNGETEKAGEVLSRINFLGLSTFGEQYGAVHINQTLTGVVIGG